MMLGFIVPDAGKYINHETRVSGRFNVKNVILFGRKMTMAGTKNTLMGIKLFLAIEAIS